MTPLKKFHKDKTEAKYSDANIDFTESSLKKYVSTSPLISGGSNFKTHTLIKKYNSKISYKASLGGVLFVFIFFGVGLGLIIFNLINYKDLFSFPSVTNYLTLSIGLLFSFVSCYIGFYLCMPRVFDKRLGYYFKSYKYRTHKRSSKNYVLLKSIIAIQIIGESISSDNGSYGSFELNLVLDDNTRKNVIDHGHLKSIINDAYVISNFLNIPIWHAENSKG